MPKTISFDDNKEAYAAAIGDAIIATYKTYHGDGTGGNTEADTSIGDTTTGDTDTDGTSGSTEDSTATEDTKTLEKLLPTSRLPMWKLWMEPVRTGGRA